MSYVRGIPVFIFTIIAAAVVLAGCQLSLNSATVGGSTPGSYALFAVGSYPPPQSPVPLATAIIPVATNVLGGAGWTQTVSAQNQNVTLQNFTSSFSNSDLLIFAGHGFTGIVAFSNFDGSNPTAGQYWGAGDDANSLPSEASEISGRLKWMILESSDTVAPPLSIDPDDDPQFVANNWDTVFSGSLREMLGYWQAPQSINNISTGAPGCQTQTTTRDCDVTAGTNAPTLQATFQDAIGSSSNQDLADAWENANRDNGNDGIWSILSDSFATSDVLTGPGSTLSEKSGNLEFTSEFLEASEFQPPGTIAVADESLPTVPLVNENLNVAGLVQNLDSTYSLGAYSTTSSASTTTYKSSEGVVVHSFPELSGAVTHHGTAVREAMTLSEAQAQAAAVTYVDNTFGMPSDAALFDVLSLYETTSSARVLIGYEFIWTHSSGEVFGGDAIKVLVGNNGVTTTTCLKTMLQPPLPKPVCISVQRTVTYSPEISYGYRLWRSLGSVSQGTSSGATLDSLTASRSLPDPSSVASYQAGYWTTGPFVASGNAEPVWMYHLTSGQWAAVDAVSGAMVGSESQ